MENAQSYPVAPRQAYSAPIRPLKTNRSLAKYILLGIITCGIYDIVVLSGISTDINTIASRYDGKKTMHFCLMLFIFMPITAFIADFVWFHKISARIGQELRRRSINFSFGARDYWLWCILGSLIIIGPYVYIYDLIAASNKLAEDYNING